MASDGVFSDRIGLPVPGDGQDNPSDDETQARSISDPNAENWGDIIQTLLLDDIDDRLVEFGSESGRASAGVDAPRWFVVTDGGDSNDQPYLTYNDDTQWHLVTPVTAERTFVTDTDSAYDASFGESIWADAGTNGLAINLPAPRDRGNIRIVVVNTDNDNVVIQRSDSSEEIDGDASDIVVSEETVIELESDGTNWRRVIADTNQFSTKEQSAVISPNGHIPTVLLQDSESSEISVPVPDGSTLTVYRWGSYKITDGTAPSGLRVELLDGGDNVREQENTVNTQSTSSPPAEWTNSTGSLQIFKLRVVNGTGSDLTTDGVGAVFGYVVE